jgi:hypothetical protein
LRDFLIGHYLRRKEGVKREGRRAGERQVGEADQARSSGVRDEMGDSL